MEICATLINDSLIVIWTMRKTRPELLYKFKVNPALIGAVRFANR